MQVQPVSAVRTRVRMWVGCRSVPQGQRHSLSGVGPPRWSSRHEIHRTCCAETASGIVLIAGKCDGEAGPQVSGGTHPRQMPAQQVGREVEEVVLKAFDQVGTAPSTDGVEIDIGVETCCGARADPVTGTTCSGGGFDHGGRYRELAGAEPGGEAGRYSSRGREVHQHSPRTTWTPNLCSEEVNTRRNIPCRSPLGQRGRVRCSLRHRSRRPPPAFWTSFAMVSSACVSMVSTAKDVVAGGDAASRFRTDHGGWTRIHTRPRRIAFQ